MTRCSALAALAAVLLAAPASAQLSFSADDFYRYEASGVPVVQDVFSTDVNEDVPASDRDRIQALIALRGQGQTWDFTTIAYPNETVATTTLYYDGDQTAQPGASNFPDADIVFVNDTTSADGTSTAYVYGQLSSSLYTTLGIYGPPQPSTGGEEYLETFPPDGLDQLSFPLTFGSVTTDQTVTETDAGPLGTITTTVDYRNEVVGSGTLITPTGTFPTLMIEFKVTTTTAIPGAPSQPFEFNAYSWTTNTRNTADAVYQEVSNPMGGTSLVVEASYTTPAGGATNNAPTVSGTVEADAVAGVTAMIDVLANVSDPDGDALTITEVSDPDHGDAEIGDDGSGRRRAPVVLYTADDGYEGEDTFTFTVSDGTAEATGSVTVMVTDGTAVENGPEALVLAIAPNPSTGDARVLLTTQRADVATVTVWDAVGREVARLHDGPLSAGAHTFSLDDGALAPGVYLARVALGEAVTTARLTIAR